MLLVCGNIYATLNDIHMSFSSLKILSARLYGLNPVVRPNWSKLIGIYRHFDLTNLSYTVCQLSGILSFFFSFAVLYMSLGPPFNGTFSVSHIYL